LHWGRRRRRIWQGGCGCEYVDRLILTFSMEIRDGMRHYVLIVVSTVGLSWLTMSRIRGMYSVVGDYLRVRG